MPNFLLNRHIKAKQFKVLLASIGTIAVIAALILTLISNVKPKKPQDEDTLDLAGIIDASFTDANVDSALTSQQSELESLKRQISVLEGSFRETNARHQKEIRAQALEFKKEIKAIQAANEVAKPVSTPPSPELKISETQAFWQKPASLPNSFPGAMQLAMAEIQPKVHAISFRAPKKREKTTNYLNPAHYVPSNTSVQAVILGGSDADASVNGQSKNNGVMLFKFLENGTLPNGQRSRLRGCRVSANAYGDISSERAFATLYRLSCAHPGEPIIDKEVTGWVFFNGKVGIKGRPLMRDNKVMTWAGVSGALSGIASAAQYAQSAQNIGPYGATSVVPSGNIGPYAAYGGASKAADTLSQYYVKRAEQYHPVIQVGSGNVVTIVFKDGFYLEADEDIKARAENETHSKPRAQNAIAENEDSALNFTVPPEVLSQIARQDAASGVHS